MTSECGHAVGPPAGRRGGAFSLIEVMLGVLILALGLLGLAAVMPAVVAQQRNAANTTLGESAISSAKDYLARRGDLMRIGSSANPRGIGIWYWDFNFWSVEYEWEYRDEIDPDSGTFELISTRTRAWSSPSASVCGRASPAGAARRCSCGISWRGACRHRRDPWHKYQPSTHSSRRSNWSSSCVESIQASDRPEGRRFGKPCSIRPTSPTSGPSPRTPTPVFPR